MNLQPVTGNELKDYDPTLGRNHLRLFDSLNFQAALSRASSDDVPSLLLPDGTYQALYLKSARREATLLGIGLNGALEETLDGKNVRIEGKVVDPKVKGYSPVESGSSLWRSLSELVAAIDITQIHRGVDIPLGQVLVYAEPANYTQPTKLGKGQVDLMGKSVGFGRHDQFKKPRKYTAVAYLTWLIHTGQSSDENLAKALKKLAENYVFRERLLRGGVSGGQHLYAKYGLYTSVSHENLDAISAAAGPGVVLPVKTYK